MKRDATLQELFESPWNFEFSQALRILLRNSEHGKTPLPEDRRYDAEREPVRIGVNQSLGFPASDIQALDPAGDGEAKDSQRAEMLINFMGLTGPSGVLPLPYTLFLMDKQREGDNGPAEFLDIFNHRFAMLSYYAWEKYRHPVVRERQAEHDFYRQIMLSLAGLGTEYLQKRQFTADDVFAKYAGLLAIQPRSAASLEMILCEDLGVPVTVEQFAGNWYRLDEESTTRFRDDASDSERLGFGVVASEEYWSQEFMARLRIGPLDLKTFRGFLPGGPGLKHIEEICRFFSRDELVFEVQLVLRKEEVPGTELSADEEAGQAQLGWTTWARTAADDENSAPLPPYKADADDVVIRL